MISKKLQEKFYLLEMAAFPVWRAAGAREKDKITKQLGEYEAWEIIKEINKDAKNIQKSQAP